MQYENKTLLKTQTNVIKEPNRTFRNENSLKN